MRYCRKHRHLVTLGDERRQAHALIDLYLRVQHTDRQYDTEHHADGEEVPEPQTARLQRQRRRLLNLERQTLVLAIDIHRHARVLAPTQEILIDVAIHLVIARQLRQRRFAAVDALAAIELVLQLT